MNTKMLKLAKLVLKFAEIETDKAILVVGDELAVGVEVYVEKDGEYLPAEDGEYIASDKKITVKNGLIEELEALEEVAEDIDEEIAEDIAEEIAEEDMAKKRACMEEEAPAEAPAEAPVEPDEKDLRIAELEGLLKDRDAIIEELNAKLAELEAKVAKPVEEPVKMNRIEKIAQNKNNSAMKYFE